tara:strand:+ start:5632 stop:6672 length:1041 start_codon:yes stop_codon:yes gene_type:complete
MSQKTIQINPAYLSISRKKGGGNTKTKKERKMKPTAQVNPSKLRKELLTRIKDHQDKTEKKINVAGEVKKDDEFTTKFHNSMDYLEELSKKRKERKKQQKIQKQTKKQQHRMQNQGNTANIFVNTELPQEMNLNTLKPEVAVGEMPEHSILQSPTPNIRQAHNQTLKREPTYSCLKNGSRPTFKEMIRNTVPVTVETFDAAQIQVTTMPESPMPVDSPMPVGPLPSAHVPERTTKMEELKAKYELPKKPTLEKRIKTYKYKLGKKDKNVSVLIKNNKTRRNVKMAHAELKKNSLLEIKKYLKAHNLLKSGSEAPPDVLRQLYEQTKLAGEINNNNSDNMLHNYLSK